MQINGTKFAWKTNNIHICMWNISLKCQNLLKAAVKTCLNPFLVLQAYFDTWWYKTLDLLLFSNHTFKMHTTLRHPFPHSFIWLLTQSLTDPLTPNLTLTSRVRKRCLTLSLPDIFFFSNLALNLEYDRAWQIKHCLHLQFLCKVNKLREKGAY